MIENLPKVLQDVLGFSEAQIQRLIARSPHTYKVYSIPKKSGGVRTIAQPAKETKFLQRWLIQNVFNQLPIHQCAAAYKSGASIKSNAAAHKENQYISKFDFAAFFPSIKAKDLISHFSRYLGNSVSAADIKNIARLSCISPKEGDGLGLSVGAPSSPILSNSIMYDFDEAIYVWCQSKRLTYTRYADDLTFSTKIKGVCAEIEPKIKEVIRSLAYPSLTLNTEKTIHLSKKNQRRITGVIVNNEGQLSIGRARKRTISALIHQFLLGKLSPPDIYHLQGLLGFSKDIEPEFVSRMKAKYGPEIIGEIFEVRKIASK